MSVLGGFKIMPIFDYYPREPWDRRPWVYVCRDADETIIYIGASEFIHPRLTAHRSKRWWPDVAVVELFPCTDKESMRQKERCLICQHRPRHNLQIPDPHWCECDRA